MDYCLRGQPHHITCLLYPSIAPCIQKPKGFSLSYPSICQMWFGPSILYSLLCKRCLDLAATPSGSVIFKSSLTVSWSTIRLYLFINLQVISLYPNLLPLPRNSHSIARQILSILERLRILPKPRLFRILFSC